MPEEGRQAMGEGRMPTLRDVAERSKVSASTVSAVLNGAPRASRFAAETCARIKAAADELGYMPNPLAQRLKQLQPRQFGVLMLNRSSIYNVLLMEPFERAANARGYGIVTASMGFRQEDAAASVQLLCGWRVRGIVLLTGGRPMLPQALDLLRKYRIPYIHASGMPAEKDAACMLFRNAEAGVLLADHFAALGHRRMAVIAAESSNRQSEDRAAGILRRCAERGLPAPLVVRAAGPEAGFAAGFDLAARALSLQPETTALVCLNDTMAIGAMQCCRRHGIDMPGRMSVSGFDDLCVPAQLGESNRLGRFVSPALTTIRTPFADAAGKLAHLLADAAEQGPAVLHAQVIELRPELVVRESTGPAALA